MRTPNHRPARSTQQYQLQNRVEHPRDLPIKWIRIIYRCWEDRTPYDESTYLNTLKRRGSPLLNSVAATPYNA
jgi:hypothetical protein